MSIDGLLRDALSPQQSEPDLPTFGAEPRLFDEE